MVFQSATQTRLESSQLLLSAKHRLVQLKAIMVVALFAMQGSSAFKEMHFKQIMVVKKHEI